MNVVDYSKLPIASPWRRAAYVALGSCFVALAAVGAFLPVLPTTPFLLLASFFYVRSSPYLYRRLVASRLFGPFICDWNQHRGVRLHVKFTAVTACLATVVMSVVIGNLSLPLLVLLGSLALVGIVVVLRLPLVTDDLASTGFDETAPTPGETRRADSLPPSTAA